MHPLTPSGCWGAHQGPPSPLRPCHGVTHSPGPAPQLWGLGDPLAPREGGKAGEGQRTPPRCGGRTHLVLAPGRGVAGGVLGFAQRDPLPTTVKSDDGLDGVVCGEEEDGGKERRKKRGGRERREKRGGKRGKEEEEEANGIRMPSTSSPPHTEVTLPSSPAKTQIPAPGRCHPFFRG